MQKAYKEYYYVRSLYKEGDEWIDTLPEHSTSFGVNTVPEMHQGYDELIIVVGNQQEALDAVRRLNESIARLPIIEKPGFDDETYYSEGKDMLHFEMLSDKDFAWEATKMAQDLADMDTGSLESWLPFIGVLDNAADRIKRLDSYTNGMGSSSSRMSLAAIIAVLIFVLIIFILT